jgi:Tol biopolymer transport system component
MSKLVVSFLGCAFVLTMLAQGQGDRRRGWGDLDPFRLKDVHSLQLSPPGDQLAFVLSERSVANNRSYSSVWVLSTTGGKPTLLTEPQGYASSPRWSPDGKQIAYFASAGGELGLWLMNADGSDKRELTTFERSNAFVGDTGNELTWSPNGKQLAFTAAGPRHYSNIFSPLDPPNGNNVMIVDRLLYKSDYYYSDLRRTYVWVISATGGEATQIASGDYDFHSIENG